VNKETRNRIQRATQAARALLEREYAEQLEGTFDIHLDGTIAAEPGSHLDGRQRLVRRKLVAAVEHIRAGGATAAEAVSAYLREAAFTTLNRFVALKMLEARGLVQECISRGEESAGFREFTGLAPGLLQLPDHGYRLYIESLFDEIGREVRVLFDRRDPASLLWPRRTALHELLAVLNDQGSGFGVQGSDPEPRTLNLEPRTIWDQDETIGWVYQYFNGDDERRQMRAESQAPRNSRELAVRNQFFTPRYVVEFLTDNTLGRTWYEMRRADTQLAEECDYLVRRPSEVFLAEEEEPPAEPEEEADLTQEELLKKTVYIPFRAKKDPRDIKVLDPACGSGHFLLYAFDLLLTIYEEGWADEAAPESDATGHTLRDDYPELDSLHRALPGLILRHNLHGIDIDPRAVQIAALALWMRAQRAYGDLQIPRGERPPIQKTNIVVAEPMPGEKAMLREFTDTLRPPLLGQVVEAAFDQMRLAGEAGSLLRIEEAIAETIAEAKKQWLARPEPEQLSLFPEERARAPEQLALFDLSEITDGEFWQEAEGRIYETLRDYAALAANGATYTRKLFADDAERGFAFIDLCRQRYDVVLMNPPFGAPSTASKPYLTTAYPRTKNDLLATFVERGLHLLHRGALLGAITSRTGFFLSSFRRWREEILLQEARPTVVADLGHGVMDAAMVEAAAYCLEATP